MCSIKADSRWLSCCIYGHIKKMHFKDDVTESRVESVAMVIGEGSRVWP